MKLAMAVLLIAVSFSGEENRRADVQAKANEQLQPAPTKENQQASTPNALYAEEKAPKWYASPEWWLVILGFPTLFFIGWQAWEMRKGGETTGKQIRHLINVERAWLVDTLVTVKPGPHLVIHADTTSVRVDLFWNNHGKTPAWVIEVRIKMVITDALPEEPDMTLPDILNGPYPVVPDNPPTRDGHRFFLQADAKPNGKTTVIYGVIKYRDAFTPEDQIWETWFGYRVHSNGDPERLPSERYNRNT